MYDEVMNSLLEKLHDDMTPEVVRGVVLEYRNKSVAELTRAIDEYNELKTAYKAKEKDYLALVDLGAYYHMVSEQDANEEKKNLVKLQKDKLYRQLERAEQRKRDAENQLFILDTVTRKMIRMCYN